MRIETERLLIRNFVSSDWRDLQEMIIQKEASEYAVYDHQWPTSEGEIRGIVDWFASGDSFLAVCLKDGAKLIGFIALNRAGEGSSEFDLGYCLNSDYHGQGYATEGCLAVLDHAFRELGADRVTSGTAEANVPSCRLLARLGMKKVGEGKGSFRKTSEGEPIEFRGYLFALSRDEWLGSRAGDSR